jgi:hypothetical protein
LSRLALAIAVTTAQGAGKGAGNPKDAKDVKDAKGRSSKDSKDVKDAKDAKDAMDAAGARDLKGPAGPSRAGAATLIFDEIDAGVGGTVADSVGRLMKQLGDSAQVLAVTHLAQVAACADHHLVVSKALKGKQTLSALQAVEGEARVAEIARMLGGGRLSGTAHAQAMLGAQARPPEKAR